MTKTKLLKVKLTGEEFGTLTTELCEANNAEQYYLDNDCYDKAERKELKQRIKERHKLVDKLCEAWNEAR